MYLVIENLAPLLTRAVDDLIFTFVLCVRGCVLVNVLAILSVLVISSYSYLVTCCKKSNLHLSDLVGRLSDYDAFFLKPETLRDLDFEFGIKVVETRNSENVVKVWLL